MNGYVIRKIKTIKETSTFIKQHYIRRSNDREIRCTKRIATFNIAKIATIHEMLRKTR